MKKKQSAIKSDTAAIPADVRRQLAETRLQVARVEQDGFFDTYWHEKLARLEAVAAAHVEVSHES